MAAALLPGSRSWLTSRAYKLQATLFHPGLSPQFDRATNAIYLRQCHRLAAGRGSAWEQWPERHTELGHEFPS
eukprot:jgi/Chrpa1/14628/Chrysochromulina_OHIO_Genome00010295-RA